MSVTNSSSILVIPLLQTSDTGYTNLMLFGLKFYFFPLCFLSPKKKHFTSFKISFSLFIPYFYFFSVVFLFPFSLTFLPSFLSLCLFPYVYCTVFLISFELLNVCFSFYWFFSPLYFGSVRYALGRIFTLTIKNSRYVYSL